MTNGEKIHEISKDNKKLAVFLLMFYDMFDYHTFTDSSDEIEEFLEKNFDKNEWLFEIRRAYGETNLAHDAKRVLGIML